jgi:peptidoglycan hydrolase-like protein with peptidoglycan-binding domain
VPALSVAAAAAVILAAAGVYYYLQHPSAAQAAGNVGHKLGASGPPAAKEPEQVVSVSPADGATKVDGGGQISVVFSEPLSANSPMPTLKPAIKGTWQRSGDTAVFQPSRGFSPRTKVTLTIPAGSTGVQSAGGGLLATSVTAKFRTGTFSSVRMEQLLAQLGYLPLTWVPSTGKAAPLSDPNAQLSAAYDPPQGIYTWQRGYPIQLKRLWRPDRPSEVLRGAVIAFESDHGLALDGMIGTGVWHAMFRALTHGQLNTHGYTYALASQRPPETLTVWHNGAIVFKHLANTGIPIRPTAVRTDPVYLRYRFQIMKGTNPDGTKYADPVAWVAYFHYGEAVHYFPRYSYGSQQSLGCVELPYAPAKRVWPYLTFGTLVTVTAP